MGNNLTNTNFDEKAKRVNDLNFFKWKQVRVEKETSIDDRKSLLVLSFTSDEDFHNFDVKAALMLTYRFG